VIRSCCMQRWNRGIWRLAVAMLWALSSMTEANATTASKQPDAPIATPPAILYVVDGSSSMWNKIDGTAKITLVRELLAHSVVNYPSTAKPGLIAFGHRIQADCNDFELLAPIGAPPALFSKRLHAFTPKGRTPLAEVIKLAIERIKAHGGRGTIVLISDGRDNCSGDPCDAAAGSGSEITIDVVGLHLRPAAVEQLRCVAEQGGGHYYAADSKKTLQQALNTIEQTLLANVATAVSGEKVAPSHPQHAAKATVTPSPATPLATQPAAPAITFQDQWDRDRELPALGDSAQHKGAKPTMFRDNFDGQLLSDAWQIINPNLSTMRLEGGKLILHTEPGALPRGDVANLLLLERTAGEGGYRVTTSLKSEFSSGEDGKAQQQAGLLLYHDRRNYLGLVVENVPHDSFGACRSTPCRQVVRVRFTAMERGRPRLIGKPLRIAWHPPQSRALRTQFFVRLKLQRSGQIYTAYASLGGNRWHRIGQLPFYRGDLVPALYASSNMDLPYAEVAFDAVWMHRVAR